MAHSKVFDADDPCLLRVRSLTTTFPGVGEKISHGRPAFFTKKVFAYFGASVRTEGSWVQHPHCVVVAIDPSERDAMLGHPRVFVPAYLGAYGWIGFDIIDDGDWDEVAELLDSSYRLTAPPKLVAQLAGPTD